MVLIDTSTTIKCKCPDNLCCSSKTKFHPYLSRGFEAETLMHDL
jgi:hypothetical protein